MTKKRKKNIKKKKNKHKNKERKMTKYHVTEAHQSTCCGVKSKILK